MRLQNQAQERVPFHPERAVPQGYAQLGSDPERDSTKIRSPLPRRTTNNIRTFPSGFFASSHDKQPTVETVAGVLDSRDGDPSARAWIDIGSPILEFLNIKWLRDLPQVLRVPVAQQNETSRREITNNLADIKVLCRKAGGICLNFFKTFLRSSSSLKNFD